MTQLVKYDEEQDDQIELSDVRTLWNTFKTERRDVSNENSLSYWIRNDMHKEVLETDSTPKSIQGSSFYNCQRQFLYKAFNMKKTNWRFRWYNEKAADAGDGIHGDIQREMVQYGYAVNVIAHLDKPGLTDRLKREENAAENAFHRNWKREQGILEPAIEVNTTNYYEPLSSFARSIYRHKGLYLPRVKLYKRIRKHRLGVRLDSVVRLPWYDRDIPVEIKTVASKYWKGGKNHALLPKKIIGYIMQLQLQMSLWQDHVTGETPQWGMVYIINRDDPTQRIEEYVEYNPYFVEYQMQRILGIKEAWDNKILLPGEPSEDECKWCDYQSACDEPEKFPHMSILNPKWWFKDE